jgi:hypothetical protein
MLIKKCNQYLWWCIVDLFFLSRGTECHGSCLSWGCLYSSNKNLVLRARILYMPLRIPDRFLWLDNNSFRLIDIVQSSTISGTHIQPTASGFANPLIVKGEGMPRFSGLLSAAMRCYKGTLLRAKQGARDGKKSFLCGKNQAYRRKRIRGSQRKS